jgi:hypothetical protein
VEVLQRLGGKSDLKTLMQTSKLDEKAFWDSVNSLLRSGDIELQPNGIIKLKMRAA